MKGQVDVCYVLSHGFAARMILHSDILPPLREAGVSVALVMPNAAEGETVRLAERYGAELVQAPAPGGRMLYEYERWRRYTFEDFIRNPALRARYRQHLAGWRTTPFNAMRAVVYGILGRLSLRLGVVRRAFEAVERRVLQDEDVDRMLERLRPRLLVTTYPVDAMEASFMRAARRAGIPTVSHLLSWDNITSKGRFPVPASYFITWGPIMSREVREYYRVPEERIFQAGVPHFDRHATAPSRDAQRVLLRGLGLDPDRPYLFYGMSSPVVSPHEIDLVEWMAARVTAGAWGDDVQLVVRPHPQNVSGYMADPTWLERLDRLQGPGVGVDYPALQEGSKLAWNMEESDLAHLANLLAGCSICLNAGSTLSIDAVVHDKPVVIPAFDAGFDLPWWKSARRMVDTIHMRKILDLGGIRVVRSFAELEEEVGVYLKDPARDAEGRRRIRDQQCGPCDGDASLRVAEALIELLDRTGGKAPRTRSALVSTESG